MTPRRLPARVRRRPICRRRAHHLGLERQRLFVTRHAHRAVGHVPSAPRRPPAAPVSLSLLQHEPIIPAPRLRSARQSHSPPRRTDRAPPTISPPIPTSPALSPPAPAPSRALRTPSDRAAADWAAPTPDRTAPAPPAGATPQRCRLTSTSTSTSISAPADTASRDSSRRFSAASTATQRPHPPPAPPDRPGAAPSAHPPPHSRSGCPAPRPAIIASASDTLAQVTPAAPRPPAASAPARALCTPSRADARPAPASAQRPRHQRRIVFQRVQIDQQRRRIQLCGHPRPTRLS